MRGANRKWRLLAAAAVLGMGLVSCGYVEQTGKASSEALVTESSVETSEVTQEPTVEVIESVEATPEPTPEVTPEPTPTLTLGQINALKKAELYLKMTAFSYSGLIKQLEFEGFTNEEAVYGADSCGADWNEQAARKAEAYLELTAFSKKQLIQQLEFEGFTSEQAEYGVAAVGY